MAAKSLKFAVGALLLGQALGWWPFGSEPAATVQQAELAHAQNEDQVQQAPAKFEVSNAEQKFLAEAHRYLNLSPLEKCQHHVSCPLTCISLDG